MRSLPAPAPVRLFFIAVSVLLALALGGCAGMLTRDPIRINVVNIEPLAGQGLEMRFTVKLRLQNPNETAIEYNGVALELELNGKPFASGVSDQKGSVSRFGETVFSVPVTVSAFAAVRKPWAWPTARNSTACRTFCAASSPEACSAECTSPIRGR